MIVTLTPNPSLDRTVTLPTELQRGGVNRLESVVTEPGGKASTWRVCCPPSAKQVTAVLPAAEEDPYWLPFTGYTLPDWPFCPCRFPD